MYAGLMISKRQYPKRIFDEFLKKIKNKDTEGINKINKERFRNIEYGIDEIMLNYYLMPWIVKEGIIYGCEVRWGYS